jgi:hypothetical protein
MVSKFGWANLMPAATDDMASWWLRARKMVPKPWRPAFDSVVLLISRGIWLHRNERVFNDVSLSLAVVVHRLVLSIDDWCKANLVARSLLYRE